MILSLCFYWLCSFLVLYVWFRDLEWGKQTENKRSEQITCVAAATASWKWVKKTKIHQRGRGPGAGITKTNFADMLHLLTISLARPLLLWRSGGYCRHSYQGSQPASINRLQREILGVAGRHCESNYIRRTCHRIHKGAMHCDSFACKKGES